MPKRRFWNPLKRKKYSAQTMRNRSLKNAETLLLEPTKNKEKRLPQARQTFAQRKTWKPASHQAKLKKKVFGTRMRKGRTPAGFVPKPLRNRSRKNAETSLLEPIKKKERGPKPCETAARKLPKRCFWNLLKTKKKPASYQAKLKKKVFGTRVRKSRTPAGFVPKPLRNRSQKNAETSLLEPTKNKEERLPQARQTFAQRKTWKPASHQAKLKKKVFGTRMRKGRTPAGLAPKPLRNRSQKNAETSLLEPTKNKEI